MEAPTVLLYNLDSEKEKSVKLLCLLLKLRVRTVDPGEYGLTLEALLAGERPEQPAEASFPDEMLVMAHLSSAQMNGLLQGFRKRKISPVALKAVLTPTNAGWDSLRLRDELAAERQAVLRGESAHGQAR